MRGDYTGMLFLEAPTRCSFRHASLRRRPVCDCALPTLLNFVPTEECLEFTGACGGRRDGWRVHLGAPGPCVAAFNDGGATIQSLAMALQAATNGMDAEKDVLFLILTSHGSRAGLAVKAGRLTQLLTPVNLADMLALTGVRHKVVVISACYSGVFIPRLANPNVLVITRPMLTIRRSAAGTRPSGPTSAMPFSTWHSGKLEV